MHGDPALALVSLSLRYLATLGHRGRMHASLYMCTQYMRRIYPSLCLHLPWQMISYMYIRLPRMDECRLLFLYLSILQWTCLSTTHFVPAVHLSSPYTGKCYGAPTFHNSWLSRVRVHDIHILLSSQCFILPLPASAAGPPNTWSLTSNRCTVPW